MKIQKTETKSDPLPDYSGTDGAGVKRRMLNLHGVGKSYSVGGHSLSVLRDVSLTIHEGETCAIVGPSGSGKTTLLGLCAGLDDPSEGEVELVG